MDERLEQVRDWSELRTLLRVVIKSCRYCGRDHEVTLTRQQEVRHHTADGRIDWGVAWVAEPRPDCAKDARAPLVVARLAVTEGRVFRVVDDALESETTREVERPKERVR